MDHQQTGMAAGPTPMETCFILGITKRSGTNFLYALLRLHPHCFTRNAIREDFLVAHSDLLVDYVDTLRQEWNPSWGIEDTVGSPELLLRYLGDALERYLALQAQHPISLSAAVGARETTTPPKILITKTPSVRHLEHFRLLFPDAPLLILTRDGRSVVESGMRSFNWDFEWAARHWADAGRKILEFHQARAGDRHLIVRYEDLHRNTEHELRRILAFLGLDWESYDFEAAQALPVFGSSDLREQGQEAIDWRPVDRQADFDPLRRWSNWSERTQQRFNWIAGDCLAQLGYSPVLEPAPSALQVAKNNFLDAAWKARFELRALTGRSHQPSGYKQPR